MRIYGHRGAAGEAPENTLGAIACGLQAGCHGIEIDTWLVAGQAVVIHDADLQRVASDPRAIHDCSVAELATLNLGGGEGVPTLAAVVAATTEVVLNIELKEAAVAEQVAVVSDDHREVLYSSFHTDALAAMQRLRPDRPRALCAAAGNADGAIRRAHDLGCVALHIPVQAASAAVINQIVDAGLQVSVYTVNDLITAERLAETACYAIFSDVPTMMVQHFSS